MKGQAPQTPHQFNGYTSPPWIPWLIHARMQYQKKPWRSTCENTCIRKYLGDQRARIHVSENPEGIEAIEAIEGIEGIEAIEAIEAVEAIEAIDAIEANEAIEAIEAIEGIEAFEAIEAFGTIEAIETIEGINSATKASIPHPLFLCILSTTDVL